MVFIAAASFLYRPLNRVSAPPLGFWHLSAQRGLRFGALQPNLSSLSVYLVRDLRLGVPRTPPLMPPLLSGSSPMPMATAASSASLDAFGSSTYNPRMSMAEPILSINQSAAKGLSPSSFCFRPPRTSGLINPQTLTDRVNPCNKSSNPPTNSTASSSLTCGSCPQAHSGSEEEPQHAIDQRKQKRMISNRESARRSRMRKQQHLDDLKAQIVQLRAENNHLLNKFNLASQHYLQIEGENRALRSHAMDLSHKLRSLQIAMQQTGGLQSFELGSDFLDSVLTGKMEMNPCYFQPSVSQSMAAAEIPH